MKQAFLLFLSQFLLVSAVLAQGDDQTDRPNIIFLFSDDQRDGSFGAMGHPHIKSPNIDKLIRGGVRFCNTYVAEPTCAPSRIAVFTGVRERVSGVGWNYSSPHTLNETEWEATYPALLRKHGYFTGFIGKFGVQNYTFRDRAAEKFDYWRAHDGWANFFFKTARNCKAYHDSKLEIITEVTGESMVRFLELVPGDTPFCLSVSFSVPHGSQVGTMHPSWNEPASLNPKLKGHPVFDALYRNEKIKIPEDTATDPYRFIPKFIMDQDQGRRSKTYAYDYNRATCLEHHIRYYQTVTGMDVAVGQLLAALKKRGLDRNTVIIFGSDHGLLMGEYGMGGKGLLYDLSSRIPCFIYDPRLLPEKRGKTLKHLVSSIDFTTTILDYAGIEPPRHMVGKSLAPLVEGKPIAWRERLFLENHHTNRDTPFSEGIRWKNWKYIRMFEGKNPYTEKDVDFRDRKAEFEQLFDLHSDPGERDNLVNHPEHEQILKQLRTACREEHLAIAQRRVEYRKIFKPTIRADFEK